MAPFVKVLWQRQGVKEATWVLEFVIRELYPEFWIEVRFNIEDKISLRRGGCRDLNPSLRFVVCTCFDPVVILGLAP